MKTNPRVFVTGGAGFIGSHCSKMLKAAGFDPIVYDNLQTGHAESVKWGKFLPGELTDHVKLAAAIEAVKPVAVMHLAASAYVGESVIDPAKYYRNNVVGMESLLSACKKHGVANIIFSSSCATYGIPPTDFIDESTEQRPITPYGRTKLMGEQMLEDFAAAYGMKFAVLRFFNACGADLDGEIGERHTPETHLIPRALLAASGEIEAIEIFGSDFPTPDGTCVRDYVHVVDLARAHVRTLEYLLAGGANIKLNLGSGHGHSILEILASIEKIASRPVPAIMRPRRPGDPPRLVAKVDLAKSVLGFSAQYSDIETIVRTSAPFFGLRIASL